MSFSMIFDVPFSFMFVKKQTKLWFGGWANLSSPALSVLLSPNTAGPALLHFHRTQNSGDDEAEEKDPTAPVAEGLDPFFAVDIVI